MRAAILFTNLSLSLLLLLILHTPTILAKATATPTFTASYPCLTSHPSYEAPDTIKLRRNHTALLVPSHLRFHDCKIGSSAFSYECESEKCCVTTGDFDKKKGKAKLPKGWFVYGCTVTSLCVGTQKGKTSMSTDWVGDEGYSWDCDGTVAW